MNIELGNDTHTSALGEAFEFVLEKALNSSSTVDSPYPCAGKGLDCADLLTLQNLFGLLEIIVRAVLTVLMMVVSLTMIDADNQLKHFIVNLFGICIPSDLLMTTRNILMVADLYEPVFDLEWTNLVFYFTDYFCLLVSFQFRVLSLFVLTETCVIYIRPFIYKKWFEGRKTLLFYFVMHCAGNLLCCPLLLNSLWIAYTWHAAVPRSYYIFYYLLVIALTVGIILMTILACFFTARYRGGKYQNGASNIQKKRLIALLAFSAPTHLANLPDTVIAFCLLQSEFFEDPGKISYVPQFIFTANGFIQQFRTIIFAVCTILALPPYRKAIFELISSCMCRCHIGHDAVHRKTHVVPLSLTNASARFTKKYSRTSTNNIHNTGNNTPCYSGISLL